MSGPGQDSLSIQPTYPMRSVRQMLREAGLGEVRVWDEPDRYLALGRRGV